LSIHWGFTPLCSEKSEKGLIFLQKFVAFSGEDMYPVFLTSFPARNFIASAIKFFRKKWQLKQGYLLSSEVLLSSAEQVNKKPSAFEAEGCMHFIEEICSFQE
jgi:hypothetical protein